MNALPRTLIGGAGDGFRVLRFRARGQPRRVEAQRAPPFARPACTWVSHSIAAASKTASSPAIGITRASTWQAAAHSIYGQTTCRLVRLRDPRCKMITLDPVTAIQNPEVLRRVTQAHDGMAGVYAAVLVEGTIRAGDSVEVVE